MAHRPDILVRNRRRDVRMRSMLNETLLDYCVNSVKWNWRTEGTVEKGEEPSSTGGSPCEMFLFSWLEFSVGIGGENGPTVECRW